MERGIIHVKSERRYGCYRWGLIAGLIIFSITTTTVILLLIDQFNSRVLIAFLIFALIVLGIGSLLFVDFQRRKATRRREQSAHEWVQRTLHDQQSYTLPHYYQPQLVPNANSGEQSSNLHQNNNNYSSGRMYEIPLEKSQYDIYYDKTRNGRINY